MDLTIGSKLSPAVLLPVQGSSSHDDAWAEGKRDPALDWEIIEPHDYTIKEFDDYPLWDALERNIGADGPYPLFDEPYLPFNIWDTFNS